jgi:hypothetical protein
MSHLTIDLALDRHRTLLAEAAAYRRAAAVRPPRPKRSLSAVLARVRRAERRVPAPLSA